jgi:hypothetical protein
MKMEQRANQMNGRNCERMTIDKVFGLFTDAGAFEIQQEVWSAIAQEANRYFSLPSTTSMSTAKNIAAYVNLVSTLVFIRKSGKTDG